MYFNRENSPPKSDEKQEEELKHLIKKRSLWSLHDFPVFHNLDLTNTDLMMRLAEILGKRNKTNTEETISPILPFPRVG